MKAVCSRSLTLVPRSSQDTTFPTLCPVCVYELCVRARVCVGGNDFCAPPNIDTPDPRMSEATSAPVGSFSFPLHWNFLRMLRLHPRLGLGRVWAPGLTHRHSTNPPPLAGEAASNAFHGGTELLESFQSGVMAEALLNPEACSVHCGPSGQPYSGS